MAMAMCRVAREITMAKDPVRIRIFPIWDDSLLFWSSCLLVIRSLTKLDTRTFDVLIVYCNVAMICSCVLSEASFRLMKGRVSVPMFRPLEHKRIVGKSLNFYYGSHSIGVVSPDDLHLHSMLVASSSFFVSTSEWLYSHRVSTAANFWP